MKQIWQHPAIKIFLLVFTVFGFIVATSLGGSLVIPPVRTELTLVAERILGITDQITDLQRQLAARDSDIAFKDAAIQTRDQEIDRLKGELASTSQAKNKFESQVVSLTSQIQQIQQGTNTSQATINDLQQKLDQCRDDVNLKNKQIADLQGRPSTNPGPTPGGGQVDPQNPILFFDDFESASSAWSPVSGNWTRESGAYSVLTSGAAYTFLSQARAWDNYAVDVDVANASQATFGIVVRAKDINNLAMYFYQSGHFCFLVVTNGHDTCQRQSQNLSDTPTHIRLEVIGSRMVVYIGGAPLAEFSGSFPAQGMLGLYSDYYVHAGFDNFKVTLISKFGQ